MKLLSSILVIFLFVTKVYGDDESSMDSNSDSDDLDDSNDSEIECENENEEPGCLMPKPCWITCENMDNPIFCDAPCRPGCDCKPGFVRDKNGCCINSKQCPEKGEDGCPPNQEIGCDSPCYPNTCANLYYNGPLRVCTLMCIKQCVCRKGWTYKNCEEKICIPIKKCPICCPANREFKECGPYNPRSCEDPYANEEICEENCNRGCFCRDGLVEDGQGNCIPPDQCTLNCGPNEIEDACANPCQPTCDNPNPPVCEFIYCNKQCICRPPYIRDMVTGQCVDMKDCIRHPCLQNETYVTFGYDCKKCSNYESIICDPIPTPQCVCIEDYVRDDDTGSEYCISREDCVPHPAEK